MVAAETGDFTLGGQTWTQAEVGTLTGSTTFGSPSPYAGVGLDFELVGTAGRNVEGGVLWQGEPVGGLVGVGGSEQGNPLFEASLQAEAEALSRDISNLKAYPVVSLSLVYNL